MKKLILFLCFIALLNKGNAQEIAPALDYKNYIFHWLPIATYTIDKKMVRNNRAEKLMKSNPTAHQAFREARTREKASWVVLLGGAGLGFLAERQKSGSPAAWGLLTASIASLCSSVALDYNATSKHRKAVAIYNDKTLGFSEQNQQNQQIEQKNKTHLTIGVLPSGNFGFAWSL